MRLERGPPSCIDRSASGQNALQCLTISLVIHEGGLKHIAAFEFQALQIAHCNVVKERQKNPWPLTVGIIKNLSAITV